MCIGIHECHELGNLVIMRQTNSIDMTESKIIPNVILRDKCACVIVSFSCEDNNFDQQLCVLWSFPDALICYNSECIIFDEF